MSGARAGRAGVLAVAVVVLGAGCGSHPTSKADVVARANAICLEAFRQAQKVPTPSSPTLSAEAPYFRRVVPIIRREVTRLDALPRPAQDAAGFARFLSALHRSADAYARLTAAAEAGDAAAAGAATSALRASPARALAEQYGLTACASR